MCLKFTMFVSRNSESLRASWLADDALPKEFGRGTYPAAALGAGVARQNSNRLSVKA